MKERIGCKKRRRVQGGLLVGTAVLRRVATLALGPIDFTSLNDGPPTAWDEEVTVAELFSATSVTPSQHRSPTPAHESRAAGIDAPLCPVGLCRRCWRSLTTINHHHNRHDPQQDAPLLGRFWHLQPPRLRARRQLGSVSGAVEKSSRAHAGLLPPARLLLHAERQLSWDRNDRHHRRISWQCWYCWLPQRFPLAPVRLRSLPVNLSLFDPPR